MHTNKVRGSVKLSHEDTRMSADWSVAAAFCGAVLRFVLLEGQLAARAHGRPMWCAQQPCCQLAQLSALVTLVGCCVLPSTSACRSGRADDGKDVPEMLGKARVRAPTW